MPCPYGGKMGIFRATIDFLKALIGITEKEESFIEKSMLGVKPLSPRDLAALRREIAFAEAPHWTKPQIDNMIQATLEAFEVCKVIMGNAIDKMEPNTVMNERLKNKMVRAILRHKLIDNVGAQNLEPKEY